MKKLLILVPLLLASFAFAGTPDEDAAVASLRARFTKGELPSERDLYLGKEWVCSWHSAHAGTFDSSEDLKLRLVESGDLIFSEKTSPFAEINMDKRPQTFAFTSTGLVATAPTEYANVKTKLVYRMSRGDLIGEWAFQGATAGVNARLAKAGYSARGVAYTGAQVSGYSICPKKQVRRAYRGPWYVPSVGTGR